MLRLGHPERNCMTGFVYNFQQLAEVWIESGRPIKPTSLAADRLLEHHQLL
jgi:hypothetical protein